ncbi:MAG: GNAT family N-acetyltransferase [Oscillospiraceae bacterium]|nr:GNAT family N-acetyltransferase [Oscillospiraceae bacterium]
MSYAFTRGDVAESLSIMREAAAWMFEIGQPNWPLDDDYLSQQNIGAPAEEFVVMYDECGSSVGTLVLSPLRDNDRWLWQRLPVGPYGFLHKVAIRRAYAGQGLAKKMMQYAIAECKAMGFAASYLDCNADRPKIRAFYEDLGYILLEVQALPNHPRVKNAALYRLGL